MYRRGSMMSVKYLPSRMATKMKTFGPCRDLHTSQEDMVYIEQSVYTMYRMFMDLIL